MVEEIIEILTNNKEQISTMESVTGGLLAATITNYSGASSILERAYVTYSNEAKIALGVKKETIEKYTVYSIEVAKEMSYYTSKNAKSTYGVGITGQLGRLDPNNKGGNLNKIDISIYSNVTNKYYTYQIFGKEELSRKENKELVVEKILEELLKVLEEEHN